MKLGDLLQTFAIERKKHWPFDNSQFEIGNFLFISSILQFCLDANWIPANPFNLILICLLSFSIDTNHKHHHQMARIRSVVFIWRCDAVIITLLIIEYNGVDSDGEFKRNEYWKHGESLFQLVFFLLFCFLILPNATNKQPFQSIRIHWNDFTYNSIFVYILIFNIEQVLCCIARALPSISAIHYIFIDIQIVQWISKSTGKYSLPEEFHFRRRKASKRWEIAQRWRNASSLEITNELPFQTIASVL